MRIDNNDPRKRYESYWDWLTFDWHVVFVVCIFPIGYVFYLNTTTEV